MSVKKRGNSFSWVLKRGGKEYWTRIPAKSLSEARKIEQECCTALRSGDYFTLTPTARETLIRLHDTQEWAYPPGLRIDLPTESGEFILWDNPNEDESRKSKGAIQLFWNHPLIQQKRESTRKRYKMCFAHLIRLLGKNTPVRDIGVDHIHEYYAKRISEGASPNTIGYEVSTLSAIFTVLMSKKNLTGVTENPCGLVRGRGALSLSFASKRRSAYWSYDLINAITTVWSTSTQRPLCPDWLVPIMWTSYYTGMRLSEVLELQRHQIYLHRRMIFLTTLDQDIKEGEPKRVPIHRDLEPHLENALRVRALGIENVFLVSDRQGTRPVTKDCVELAMRRIVKVLNPNPRFSFFDLRHTFKANCRRSGIPEVISERICGHADADGYLDGKLPVSQRYGRISDEELIDAIDKLTVNHGYSEINAKPVSLFGLRQNLQPTSEDSPSKSSELVKPPRKKIAIG